MPYLSWLSKLVDGSLFHHLNCNKDSVLVCTHQHHELMNDAKNQKANT